MAGEYPVVDLTKGDVPDLAEVAEEVHRTRQPHVIRRADEDLAVLMPATKAAKRRALPKKSAEDMVAFWSSFGSWKDVGEMIGDPDIIIAATALHHNLTLVTENVRHFERIADLSLYR